MKIQLSKSSFIKGLTCQKKLFYAWFNPELSEGITPQKEQLYEVGHEVEVVARELFPAGTDMSKDTSTTHQVIQNTEIALALKEKVLYQASFGTKSGYCRTDIFINDKIRKLYEVKSSTKSTLVQIVDASFQYFIAKEAGYQPDEVSLIYLNNEYKRSGKLIVDKLFHIEDITQSVLNMQEDIDEGIKQMKDMLQNIHPPNTDIGLHCDEPYTCEFKSHCWKNIPTDSIFEIARLARKKKFQLYESGVIHIGDIPSSFKLNENQKMQVQIATEKGYVFNKPKIKEFLTELTYPLYFLDFESIQPAIPRYGKTKPYQQIVFQYSLHIQQENGDTKHYEFLADPNSDFRLSLLKSLIYDMKGKGTVLTYNQTFEIGRLKEMAEQFPKYESDVNNILGRIKDLMVVFRDRHFYHHEMRGSYSIKKVLPVLVPELSYQNLEVKDGGTASVTFEQMKKLSDKAEIEIKRKQLLDYCKLDTLAMACIVKALRRMV